MSMWFVMCMADDTPDPVCDLPVVAASGLLDLSDTMPSAHAAFGARPLNQEEPMENHEFGPEEFKNVMANVAATVTVVTANTPGGPIGLTVSAFTSVSADPPIVLVCIDKVVGSLEPLLAADGYTVNIMPQGAEDVAMLFATKGTDRFASLEWKPSATPAAGPVLADAFQTLECETIQRTEMGDHWILYGKVVAGTGSHGTPLVYLNRGFAEL